MTYKTGEIGPIGGNDEFIVRNGINSVENPQGNWYRYMIVLNCAECQYGYDICNKKRAGKDYLDELYKFIDNIDLPLYNIGIKTNYRTFIDKANGIKFLNEDGMFVIVDGDEKIVVGKIIDEEFIVQVQGAWNDYILPLLREYYEHMKDFPDAADDFAEMEKLLNEKNKKL